MSLRERAKFCGMNVEDLAGLTKRQIVAALGNTIPVHMAGTVVGEIMNVMHAFEEKITATKKFNNRFSGVALEYIRSLQIDMSPVRPIRVLATPGPPQKRKRTPSTLRSTAPKKAKNTAKAAKK